MIGFDVPLLFVLVIRFVEQFTTRTSVYLYVLSEQHLVLWIIPLVVLAGYTCVRIFDVRTRMNVIRIAMISLLGIFLIGTLLGIQIVARRATDPVLFIHDGAVQTEDAIRALKTGENPYTIDYRTRVFGAFPDVFSEATRPNPAWSHYVYLPLQVVLGVPVAVLAERLFGWFDVRLLYVCSFILLVTAGALLARRSQQRILALIFLLFNPLFTQYVVAGFNDVFFLGWIALAALLLSRNRLALAAVAMGLAVASKQSAWFVLPLFMTHVWFVSGQKFRLAARRLLPGLVVALAVILPFFLWSIPAFIDDVFSYPSGSATLSYPISGFGLGQLFLSMGVIRSMWDVYPFWIIQLVVGIPLLVLLVRWQRSSPTISKMLVGSGLLALILWFTSRFFNDNYIGVISVIFILAYAAQSVQEEYL